MSRTKKFTALSLALIMIFTAALLLFSASAEDMAETEKADYQIYSPEEIAGALSRPQDGISFSLASDKKSVILSIDRESADPFISFEPSGINTEENPYVLILARVAEKNNRSSFSVYFTTEHTGSTYSEKSKVITPYARMSGWQFLTFEMTLSPNWKGEVKSLRLDFLEGFNYPAGDICEIGAVIFAKSAEAVYDASYEAMLSIYPPVQVLSDFIPSDILHFGSGTRSTAVSVENGNLLYTAKPDYKDPQAYFDYGSYTSAHEIRRFTTNDFSYAVFRYRTSGFIPASSMELFVVTGSAKSLMDMIRIEGTYNCHSGVSSYAPTEYWHSLAINLAEDDGLPENTKLLYGWQGRGSFNGFRVDWCGTGEEGAVMEISEIMFFKNTVTAKGFSQAINTISLPLENPDAGSETDTETYESLDIENPWDTETETETEETLPVYSEDTAEDITESEADKTTAETEPEQTETDGSDAEETSDPDESDNKDSEDIGAVGGLTGGDGQPPESEGSKLPFYIACAGLALLSLSSIASVLIIRAKEKSKSPLTQQE